MHSHVKSAIVAMNTTAGLVWATAMVASRQTTVSPSQHLADASAGLHSCARAFTLGSMRGKNHRRRKACTRIEPLLRSVSRHHQ